MSKLVPSEDREKTFPLGENALFWVNDVRRWVNGGGCFSG